MTVGNHSGTTEDKFYMGQESGNRAGMVRTTSNNVRSEDDTGAAVGVETQGLALESVDAGDGTAYTTTLKSEVLENLELIFANSPSGTARQNLTINEGKIEFTNEAAGVAKGGIYLKFDGTHPAGNFPVFTADVDYVINFVYADVWSVAPGAFLNIYNRTGDGTAIATISEADAGSTVNQQYSQSAAPLLEAGSTIDLDLLNANAISGRFVISLSPVGQTVDAATLGT